MCEETTQPNNEFDYEKTTEQDAIETKEIKEKAFRIARLKKIREGLIEQYSKSDDPDLKMSLWDVVGHLKNLENEIEAGVI